jgi:hypothetical protein
MTYTPTTAANTAARRSSTTRNSARRCRLTAIGGQRFSHFAIDLDADLHFPRLRHANGDVQREAGPGGMMVTQMSTSPLRRADGAASVQLMAPQPHVATFGSAIPTVPTQFDYIRGLCRARASTYC